MSQSRIVLNRIMLSSSISPNNQCQLTRWIIQMDLSNQFSKSLVSLASLRLNLISNVKIYFLILQSNSDQEKATRSMKRSGSISRYLVSSSQLCTSEMIYSWLAVTDWTSSRMRTMIRWWFELVAATSNLRITWLIKTDTIKECSSFTWSRVANLLSGSLISSFPTERLLINSLSSQLNLQWWQSECQSEEGRLLQSHHLIEEISNFTEWLSDPVLQLAVAQARWETNHWAIWDREDSKVVNMSEKKIYQSDWKCLG